MKYGILLLALLMTAGCLSGGGEPFSTGELDAAFALGEIEPQYLKMSDGVDLALYRFPSAEKPESVLLFIHGGGAHSYAGYQYLASGLSLNKNTETYLLDLRGHGLSGGPRGDAPSVERVWEDLKEVIGYIRKQYPGLPLVLGGHSSGCGVILNYISWNREPDIDGYIFIAPYFGYKSGTERKNNKHPFSRADINVFISNGMSGGRKDGNTPAVFFNYSEESLEKDPLLLKYYTCNMANAVTPQDPSGQFRLIDKPFALYIGDMDELMDPEKVAGYLEYAAPGIRKKSSAVIVPGEKHLSILLVSGKLIRQYLDSAGFGK